MAYVLGVLLILVAAEALWIIPDRIPIVRKKVKK